MNNVHKMISPLISSSSIYFEESAKKVGGLMGRIVQFIRLTPRQVQQNPYIAAAVFVVSTGLFNSTATMIADKMINRKGHNPANTYDQKERNAFYTSRFVVALSVGCMNYVFSRAIRYPLSPKVLIGISTCIFLPMSVISQEFASQLKCCKKSDN